MRENKGCAGWRFGRRNADTLLLRDHRRGARRQRRYTTVSNSQRHQALSCETHDGIKSMHRDRKEQTAHAGRIPCSIPLPSSLHLLSCAPGPAAQHLRHRSHRERSRLRIRVLLSSNLVPPAAPATRNPKNRLHLALSSMELLIPRPENGALYFDGYEHNVAM
jgi:hypothetical protein